MVSIKSITPTLWPLLVTFKFADAKIPRDFNTAVKIEPATGKTILTSNRSTGEISLRAQNYVASEAILGKMKLRVPRTQELIREARIRLSRIPQQDQKHRGKHLPWNNVPGKLFSRSLPLYPLPGRPNIYHPIRRPKCAVKTHHGPGLYENDLY